GDPRDGHGTAGGDGALRERRVRADRELRSLPRRAAEPLLRTRSPDQAGQLSLIVAFALPRFTTVPAAVPSSSVIRRAVTFSPRLSDRSVTPVWMLISAASSGGSSGASPSGSV